MIKQESSLGHDSDTLNRNEDLTSPEPSSLNMNRGFLKGLTKKKTRDGEEPKRRGPKPDSKPALTRRQELNRQAQRTHRERKEKYIKCLEEEVIRLKDTFGICARQKEQALEENRQLKLLLYQHNISWPGSESERDRSVYFGSSSGSISGSYGTGHSEPRGLSPHDQFGAYAPPVSARSGYRKPQQAALDYDQTGIDFVLTLERPCMQHMQPLMVRAHNASPEEVEITGHALMASCPPESHIINHPEETYPCKTYDLDSPDLSALLNLSNRFNLEGEITPVMAWGSILSHPRLAELTAKDFETLKEDLKTKVRCYGFGAVLEQFEVQDALSSVFVTKLESYAAFT